MYQDFIAHDAAAAGLSAPTIDELGRKLPYRVDEVRHVIEVGKPALELAGVRLRAVRAAEGVALEIANATDADIAYMIATAPIQTTSGLSRANGRSGSINGWLISLA